MPFSHHQLMSTTFKNTGQRWTVRATNLTSFDLTWPNDFPGYPDNISEKQTLEVEAVKMVVSTVLAVANRRPRIILKDDQFFKLLEWHANGTVPALTNGAIFQFTRGGFTDGLTGGVQRTMLPSGLAMIRFSVLSLDLIGFQAGDTLDEVVIMGTFVDPG